MVVNGGSLWFYVGKTIINQLYLVSGIPTPLKNDGVSWDDDIPFPIWWESHFNQPCSSHHQAVFCGSTLGATIGAKKHIRQQGQEGVFIQTSGGITVGARGAVTSAANFGRPKNRGFFGGEKWGVGENVLAFLGKKRGCVIAEHDWILFKMFLSHNQTMWFL